MDDDLFEFEAPTEAAPELVLGKKKKKKKKKKEQPSLEQPAGDVEGDSTKKSKDGKGPADSDRDDDEAPDVAPTPAFTALDVGNDPEAEAPAEELLAAPVLSKKKKKKKKKPLHLDAPEEVNSVLKELEDEPDAPIDEVSNPEAVEVKRPSSAAKEKEKKQPQLLDEQEEVKVALKESEDEQNASIDEIAAPESVEVRRPMTAAEKKKVKKERERLAKLEKAKKEKNEIDAILAELGESEPAGSASAPPESGEAMSANNMPMTAAQKKRAKKKKKAVEEKDADADEVDALLAELAPAEDKPAEHAEAQGGDVDNLLAELAGGAEAPAAKKKAKKKKKKGAAKANDDAGDGAGEGGASAKDSKKPKKKESAAVRRMREQREKMLAEEESERRLKEEEEARIAEEERRKEEETRKKEEEKARKKAALKAKKERKRQEGTLLSKAEKERRRKAEIFRKQMLEQGMVPGAMQPSSGPQKVVYGKKKRSSKPKLEDVEEKPAAEVTETAMDGAKAEVASSSKAIDPEGPVAEPEVIPDAWDDAEDEGTNVSEGVAKATDKFAPQAGETFDGKGDVCDEENSEDGDSDEDDSEDSEYEGMSKTEIAAEKRRDAIRRDYSKRKAEALSARSPDHLRSPVICILGHVDTGKTKILDRIRKTNVQDGEAGGITQQIGATYFPIDAVKKEATKLEEGKKLEYNVPSLLIIDTPGHESFTNLRSRGSSLCDIAILVVDIMHGLEPQTRESIDLLKLRKTPFIVALNKIDRIYDWDPQPHNCPTRDSLSKQPRHAREEFMRRVQETKLQFSEIGFNTELYWENNDMRKTVSLVPTSAISGEGIPDLLMFLLALPQKLLTERLMFNSMLEATVLEVKVIEGLGTTIDIILTGGTIHEGDTLMVVGLDGPIITTIRALLTPHPMKEMRVKGQYVHHKEIKAAQGIKISADGLEKAVAGTQVMVVGDPTDEDELNYVREEVMKDFQTILTNVDRSGLGVYVQASTLGSLEALLEFLRTSKIPVSGINIGPVHKRDVTKASTMLERRKEFATVLAFDVGVEREARELAEETGVKIFTADIIYHLFDQFTDYMEEMKKQRREEVNDEVVFPSICKILPQHIYNKKDPIVLGVDVMEGILRVGTPLVVRHGDEWLDVGRVVSIELNRRQVLTASKGESVAVKIQHKSTEHIMYGRHFDLQDALVSKMSRSAIDLLKESFKDDLGKEEWILVIKLKRMFDII